MGSEVNKRRDLRKREGAEINVGFQISLNPKRHVSCVCWAHANFHDSTEKRSSRLFLFKILKSMSKKSQNH